MMNKEAFSKRQGFFSIKEKEISVREDAPEGLRSFVRMAYYEQNKKPSNLLSITTKVLKIPPDGNWTDYPNIDEEVRHHLENCDWYLVYDIIEIIIQKLNPNEAINFSNELNDYFVINGIGWKITNGQIEIRGDGLFETAVKSVVFVLETAKLETAKSEIYEALKDLSRRPVPDITGAIQHSLACLECVAREATGDKKATLGHLIKKYPDIVPKSLDTAIEKIWGFTSEQGRHLREGQAPEYLEAELVVELSAAIATYLGKKLINATAKLGSDDLPF